jgi:hypothetical protein
MELIIKGNESFCWGAVNARIARRPLRHGEAAEVLKRDPLVVELENGPGLGPAVGYNLTLPLGAASPGHDGCWLAARSARDGEILRLMSACARVASATSH